MRRAFRSPFLISCPFIWHNDKHAGFTTRSVIPRYAKTIDKRDNDIKEERLKNRYQKNNEKKKEETKKNRKITTSRAGGIHKVFN